MQRAQQENNISDAVLLMVTNEQIIRSRNRM